MPSSRSSNRYDCSRRALLGGGAAALLIGCSEDPPISRHEALVQTVDGVMLPTFAALVDRTEALQDRAEELRDDPSERAASRVREAFVEARSLWKRSEAFALGPSDDLAITGGAIDAWPAAAEKLDALIEGEEALDGARVARLPANMRGFPAIEHLAFDAAEGESVADERLLTAPSAPRRRELLANVCAELADKCRALEAAWSGPEGYGRELRDAGRGSATFARERDAVDAIVTGMLALSELMLVAKLGKPLGEDTDGAVHPEFEEAPRSDFSLTAIEQNLLGLRAVYEGKLEDAPDPPASLGLEVREASGPADGAFRSAIEAALSQVRGIDPPMRVLLATDPEPIRALLEAVRGVKRSIQTNVASALGASLGFGYSDTD